MFTAELSIWTCFSKLSTEDMLVRASVDAERNHVSCELISCFPYLNFVGMKVSGERQSYKDMPRVRDSIGAASALLVSACVPSSSWPRLMLSLGFLSAWRSRARTRVLLLECPGPSAQLCRYLLCGVLRGVKSPTMFST
jgi:hypothetical protein